MEGSGPFPALLDVHGGAWTRGKHTERADGWGAGRERPGGGGHRAPAGARPSLPRAGGRRQSCHALAEEPGGRFHADARAVGGLATSSGGPAMLLSAMRPRDPRYAVFASPGRWFTALGQGITDPMGVPYLMLAVGGLILAVRSEINIVKLLLFYALVSGIHAAAFFKMRNFFSVILWLGVMVGFVWLYRWYWRQQIQVEEEAPADES